MASDKSTKVVIWILLLVILVLVVFLAYTFLLRPVVTGYATERQVEGYQVAILQVMQQASTCQPVPLTFGNQTINLIALECLQQPQPPTQPQA